MYSKRVLLVLAVTMMLAAGGWGENPWTSLQNEHLVVLFNSETGQIKAHDRQLGKVALLDGAFGINEHLSSHEGWFFEVDTHRVRTHIGRGNTLRVKATAPDRPTLLWEAALFKDAPYVALRCGVINTTDEPMRVHELHALSDALTFPETPKNSFRMLNGSGGGGITEIIRGASMGSANNGFLTFLDEQGGRSSMSFGGLNYPEFAKYVRVGDPEKFGLEGDKGRYTAEGRQELDQTPPAPDADIRLDLLGHDPRGKLVPLGATYLPDEWFYIDFITSDPFENLERYGWMVRAMTGADPNPYTFPTVCGWYVSVPYYGGGPYINHTPGMVDEAESAAATGFLQYAPVAVRLVPDTYYGPSIQDWVDHQPPEMVEMVVSPDDNTEQGWWDDEHWRKYGHYAEPYETTAKWGEAMARRGVLPFTYVQTGLVSHDYAAAHPEHMLFNDITDLYKPYGGHNPWVTYDYTDPGFQEHMLDVWTNLGDGGVRGVMFDYPHLAWRDAGFEDPWATTTSAYRNVFDLARQGLGEDAWIHERNVKHSHPLLDVTAGLVDSQRVWGDTDVAVPEMYARCGLRWYKSRVLFAYDTDAKNLRKAAPDNADGRRQMLTMLYLTSGRLLLSTSFSKTDAELIDDLSRIYPMHTRPQSPRPLDAFTGDGMPRVYDFAVDDDWRQIAFYNPDTDNAATIGVDLGASPSEGGVGLDREALWHVYDFWNDTYRGTVPGDGRLEQELRPGEVRMMSVRRALSHPQIVSTNRHVMQGLIELSDVEWKAGRRALEGKASLIGGEPFEIAVAVNDCANIEVSTDDDGVACWIQPVSDTPAIIKAVLYSDSNGEVEWSIECVRK